MKTASGTLTTLLNSNVQFKMADLLLITFADTTKMPLCSTDFPISDGVDTYLPGPLLFKRSSTSLVAGLEADSLKVSLLGTTTYAGIPWQQAVANGLLDAARVTLQRAFMPEWGDTTPGFLWMFSGRVSDVDLTRNEVHLTVKSDIELLDRPFPRNIFQPGCTNTLFDSGCGVVKASFTTATSTLTGSTTSLLNFTSAQATGYFDLGTIAFTTGPNAGAKRTIKTHTSGTPATLALSLPLPFTPGIGDAFQVIPGCDKTRLGGCTKFSNTARHRGFQYIPRPETAR